MDGIAIGVHGRQRGAGRRKIRIRRRKIAVRLERLLDQLIEPRDRRTGATTHREGLPSFPPRRSRRPAAPPPLAAAAARGSSARRGTPRGTRRQRVPARKARPQHARAHGGFGSRMGKSGGGGRGAAGAALRKHHDQQRDRRQERDRDEAVHHGLSRRRRAHHVAQHRLPALNRARWDR